jgi:hypothetical protein
MLEWLATINATGLQNATNPLYEAEAVPFVAEARS